MQQVVTFWIPACGENDDDFDYPAAKKNPAEAGFLQDNRFSLGLLRGVVFFGFNFRGVSFRSVFFRWSFFSLGWVFFGFSVGFFLGFGFVRFCFFVSGFFGFFVRFCFFGFFFLLFQQRLFLLWSSACQQPSVPQEQRQQP